jgi:hypothetical protein
VKAATLTASNGEGCMSTCSQPYGYVHGDYFGNAVALTGATVVVGAPYASVPPAPDVVGTGTAYVFKRSGSSWTQATELYDPAEVTGGNEDYFGFEVALAGTSVVVGAPLDNNSTGAAFVFPKVGATWPTSNPTELTASDGAPYDFFGYQGLAAVSANVIAVGAFDLQREPLFLPEIGVYRDVDTSSVRSGGSRRRSHRGPLAPLRPVRHVERALSPGRRRERVPRPLAVRAAPSVSVPFGAKQLSGARAATGPH